MNLNNVSVCVVGLGYVGLPLAIEFGRRYHTVGFDVSKARVMNSIVKRTLPEKYQKSISANPSI